MSISRCFNFEAQFNRVAFDPTSRVLWNDACIMLSCLFVGLSFSVSKHDRNPPDEMPHTRLYNCMTRTVLNASCGNATGKG